MKRSTESFTINSAIGWFHRGYIWKLNTLDAFRQDDNTVLISSAASVIRVLQLSGASIREQHEVQHLAEGCWFSSQCIQIPLLSSGMAFSPDTSSNSEGGFAPAQLTDSTNPTSGPVAGPEDDVNSARLYSGTTMESLSRNGCDPSLCQTASHCHGSPLPSTAPHSVALL